LTEVGGVHRPGSGQGLERPIHGAARKARPCLTHLASDLVRGPVPTEPHDDVLPHGPLRRVPHAGREHQTTRSERSAFVSTRHPRSSTTTSSSILTPPQPG